MSAPGRFWTGKVQTKAETIARIMHEPEKARVRRQWFIFKFARVHSSLERIVIGL